MRTTTARILRGLVGSLAVGAVLSLVAAYLLLRSSLPRRGGSVAVPGLSADVEVERDSLGIPRVRGRRFEDVLRAQGFLHAQDRFFQMDLTRRAAAGELAALVGERALAADSAARLARPRRLAAAALAATPERHRHAVLAYTDGVNAGLASLRTRPPEYLLLRAEPEPWRPDDVLLVGYYFFTVLSFNHRFEKPLQVMRATLPQAVYQFLTPSTSRFDTPMVLAGEKDSTGGYRPLPIPPASELDLRTKAVEPPRDRRIVRPPLLLGGSNNWAVAGSRSAHGGALLANDTHLPLRVPNSYYRIELEWEGGATRGLSIPGTPGIVLGTSDALAWGATNSLADQTDLVVVESDPSDSTRYLTPEGPERFGIATELVFIRGRAEPQVHRVRLTRWGPVVDRDWQGRPLALKSVAFDSGGLNLALLDLATAGTLEEGIAVLESWRGPALNWLLADHAGRIGWLVNGPLPVRIGTDGSSPVSWAHGDAGWVGVRSGPRLLDPPGGLLFTANNRTLPADPAATVSRAWIFPIRAWRIAELLRGRAGLSESDLLAMQLDTRAESHDLVRNLVIQLLSADESDSVLAQVRRLVVSWNGRADADQPGFRLLHAYYVALHERGLGPLLAPAVAADSEFAYTWPLADEPLRRILEEQPPHLLPMGFPNWATFLRVVLEETVHDIADDPEAPGLSAPWGEVNRAAIRHPLGGIPLVGRWLNLPEDQLPGWPSSVRAQAPDYGSAVRMVVSPGKPERGILEMPGGQSGHVLSRHYRDGHQAWVLGLATSFQAGAAVTRLRLVAERSGAR